MSTKSTRRTFLGATAPAAVGAGLVGARALAAAGPSQPGPNDTIAMGLIGCGGRGRGVMAAFQKLPGVRIAGICDVHRDRLALAEKQTQGKAKSYHDYRKLLEDKSIDAVIVATNGHWHVLPTIDACAAGKDVYVEKPLSTSIGEGRAAVNAARKHNRIVQIGTQQRSWEHYKQAVEVVQSGALGDISHVHVWDMENQFPGIGSPPDGRSPAVFDWDFWLGPSPKVPYNPNRFIHHYWFFDYAGAWQVDWAVHHYDIVHWAMGMDTPIAATGAGGHFAFPKEKDNREWPDTFNGSCEYPPCPVAKNGFMMTYTFRGGCNDPIDGRHHAKAFYGTNAMLSLNRNGFEVRPQERRGKKQAKAMTVGKSRENHQEVFLEHLRARTRPAADVETGHRSTNPGHLMNIAWRVGRRIRWDPKTEHVIDDPAADALVTKKYRKPWSLPS